MLEWMRLFYLGLIALSVVCLLIEPLFWNYFRPSVNYIIHYSAIVLSLISASWMVAHKWGENANWRLEAYQKDALSFAQTFTDASSRLSVGEWGAKARIEVANIKETVKLLTDIFKTTNGTVELPPADYAEIEPVKRPALLAAPADEDADYDFDAYRTRLAAMRDKVDSDV